jgi:hypothetical protein
MHILQFTVACGAALLLGACSREGALNEGPDSVPDQMVIDNLRDAGSDLSKPHEIDFSFYFPDAASAQRFMLKVAKQPPYAVRLLDDDGDGEWLVEVTRTFVPSLAEIEANSNELRELAEADGGEFDGWGAAVVP